jgi:hypothetical protein
VVVEKGDPQFRAKDRKDEIRVACMDIEAR